MCTGQDNYTENIFKMCKFYINMVYYKDKTNKIQTERKGEKNEKKRINNSGSSSNEPAAHGSKCPGSTKEGKGGLL